MLGSGTIGNIVRAIAVPRKRTDVVDAPAPAAPVYQVGDTLYLRMRDGFIVEVRVVAHYPANTAALIELVTLRNCANGVELTWDVQRVLPLVSGYRYAEVA